MHETLLLSEEAAICTDCGGFYRVSRDDPGPPSKRPGQFSSENAESHTIDDLVELIRQAMEGGALL